MFQLMCVCVGGGPVSHFFFRVRTSLTKWLNEDPKSQGFISFMIASAYKLAMQLCNAEKDQFFWIAFFSLESNSRIANVCLSVHPSVCHKNPSASQNHAYQPNLSLSQPLCQSAIMPISQCAPISHNSCHFYLQSYLLAIKLVPISHLICICDFKAFWLVKIQPSVHQYIILTKHKSVWRGYEIKFKFKLNLNSLLWQMTASCHPFPHREVQ